MKSKLICAAVILSLFSVLAISVGGCQKAAERAKEVSRKDGLRTLAYADGGAAPEAAAPAEAPGSGGENFKLGAIDHSDAAGQPVTERMLIAKVALTVEVKDLKSDVRKAEQIAAQFGGYISESRIYTEETSSSATLTLMIPIKNLDKAVAKIRELGKVRYEQKSTEDVTRQFIDNEARIKNLSKEEEALAALLKRTGKLSDILEVEQELARVRTEIDQIQGQQRYLRHQSSFSTVTLSLTTKPEPPKYEGSPLKIAFFNAWHSFLNTIHGLAVLGIYALFYGPLLLIGFFILRFIIRRMRKKAA
jgi:hypothetical protein